MRAVSIWTATALLSVGFLAGLYMAGRSMAEAERGAPVTVHGDDWGGPIEGLFAAPAGLTAFTGSCASSCTYRADFLARSGNACIGPRVVMFFHAFKVGGVWTDPRDYYRPEVVAWVLAHGGFPQSVRAVDATPMPFREARKFWPVCGR